MSTGENRRSAQISELDARNTQQENSQNNDEETCEVATEDSGTGEGDFNQKGGRKKVKTRSVQDLVVDNVAYQVGNSDSEDDYKKSAVTSTGTGTALPQISKLVLLLDILKRSDTLEIFAAPVNPNEVKDYHDTIKEPMGFGTISTKLNGGSYKTLEEFEHDVFLVSSNAMVFNPSSSVYIRQARAITEMVQDLFDALKTDPENFESEISKRIRAKKRIKGCSEERQNQYLEEDQRGNYQPLDSFLNENESIVSSVYKNPKPIIPIAETTLNGTGYEDSLTQFAKDMGQTAQLVASKKLQSCTNAEAFNNQCEIPNVASGHKGIHSVSSLDFLKNSKGSQNLRGEMGTPGDKLNVEKASTLDINDHSSGGYVQTGAYGEKSIQAVGEGGLSVKQDIHQGIGCPNFTAWNTACSNSNSLVSNSIKNAKNVLMAGMSSKENSGNHKRKFVEDGNEGDNKPYQGGIPNFSTAWNTGSDRDKSISSSINRGKNFRMEHRSTGSKPDKFILSSVNKGKNFQVPEAASSNPENFEGGISNSSTTLNTGSDLDKIISSSTNKGKNFQMVEATSSTPNRTPVDTHLKFMEAVREDANKSCQGGIFNFCTTWNTGSDQDKFISSSINNGKNFEMAVATFSNPKKTPVDLFTKILEAVREGNTKSCQGGTPNFSAWNTDNKRNKFISSSINQGRNVQMAEATSSNPKKALVDPRINFFQSMEKGRTSKFDLPDQGIQSSNSAPALSGAGNSVFSTENEQGKQSIPSATDERKNVPITAVNFVSILENVDQIIGKTVQSLRAGDAVFRGHMANEGCGYCSIPLLVGGNSNLSSPLNTGGNPGQFNSAVIKGVNVQMPGMNPPNLIAAALNKGMNIQIPRMSSSGPMMQGTLSARGRGVPPSAPQQQRFPPPISRPSWNQARPMPGLNIPFPGGGSNQLPAVGNVRGTNYGSQFLQAGQTLNWHLPMHLRPQPIFTSIMQMQRRPLQVGSAGPQCIFAPRVQMQTRPPQVNLPGPVPVFSSSMLIQPRPSQVNLAGPHPIFASPIQMQPRPPQADLAGQNASSWQRGHGATAANGQQAIVNTTAMRGRYPNRDPRQNLSTGVPQHNNHGQTS